MFTHFFHYCLADYSFLALIIKLIFLEVSMAHYMEPIGRIPLLIFIGLFLFLRVTHVVYMRTQWSNFPLNWLHGTIKKLRKGKKDSLRWKEILVKDIQVGDIVRMRYCDTSPVDLLILDTSEQRYKENILKTNERKNSGQNKTRIKRAVRDLGLRSLNSVIAPKEYLSKLGKKLNGYIEYDPPSGNKNNFWGIFKLKNDPKVTQLSEENLLLGGSKLYSKEVIGMVLYTGDNCMIFQRNQYDKYESGTRRNKQAKIFSIINNMILFCTGLSIIISIIFLLTMITDKDSYNMIRAIEKILIGFNGAKKFIAILTFSMNLIPWPTKILLEVSCIIYAFRIKHFNSPGKEISNLDQSIIEKQSTFQDNPRNLKTRSASNNRRKSNYHTGSPNSKASDDPSPINQRVKNRRKTTGNI
jgi:magnesium-transporting ATPase (P-type)